MDFITLDMDRYPRKEHFLYFSQMADPKLGITVKTDVTDLVRFCKTGGCSFYTAFIHVAALAANGVPELRQRAHDGQIIQYPFCETSHIELREDHTYCYCTLYHQMDWKTYLASAENLRREALQNNGIVEDPEFDNYLLITTIPWLHYEHLTMPMDGGAFSNPQICWGKYEEDSRGRLMMPLSIYANHAMVDGFHLAQFYENVTRELNSLPSLVS